MWITNMFSNLTLDNDEKYLIVIIISSNDSFLLSTFDDRTKTPARDYCMEISKEDMFKNDLPDFIKNNTKAVIFNVMDLAATKCQCLLDHVSIRMNFIMQISRHNILHHLINTSDDECICSLIAAKVQAKMGQKILIIGVQEDDTLSLKELIRKENGYFVKNKREIHFNCQNKNNSQKRKLILGNFSPDLIISSSFKRIDSTIINILNSLKENIFNSSNNLIVIDRDIHSFNNIAVSEIYENYITKTSNNFYIIPFSMGTYVVTNKVNIKEVKDAVMAITPEDELPFTKSCIAPRDIYLVNWLCTINDEKEFELVFQSHEVKNAHKVELIFTVDIHDEVTLETKPIILPEIQELLQKLDSKKDLYIPVIGFFDNSSVICVRSENDNNYFFAESWNGLFGKDLFLSFKGEQPCMTENDKGFHVVFDLIKIMSMSPNEIKVDLDWKFTIIKDKENPVLLEYIDHDNSQRAHTPVFLMSLLLNEHIKTIVELTNVQPKKIAFHLFDNFVKNAKKRVQQQLQKSCELLSLECEFLENI